MNSIQSLEAICKKKKIKSRIFHGQPMVTTIWQWAELPWFPTLEWSLIFPYFEVRKYWQLNSSWKSIQLRTWADNCKSGGDPCWPHWVFFDQETRSTNLRNLILFTVINWSLNWSKPICNCDNNKISKLTHIPYLVYHSMARVNLKKRKRQRQILMQQHLMWW